MYASNKKPYFKFWTLILSRASHRWYNQPCLIMDAAPSPAFQLSGEATNSTGALCQGARMLSRSGYSMHSAFNILY